VQESRDSTIDFDQFLVLSRLFCACVGEGDSTVLNSFVRLSGLKFSAQPPIARTEKRKNSFSVRVCEKWNKLPAEAKNAKNVDKFKRAYRIFTAEQASEANRWIKFETIKTTPETTDESASSQEAIFLV
jgi:hypothetical protein